MDPQTLERPPGQKHYPHQQICLAWATSQTITHAGGTCADEMGTGKTHEILMLIAGLIRRGLKLNRKHGAALVVAPSVIQAYWIDALQSHITPRDQENDTA